MTQKLAENKIPENAENDKIYAICCDQSRSSMGLGYIRTAVEGVEESTFSLDWSQTRSIPIISLEREEFESGETRIISIRPVEIPARHAVIRSFYVSNGMGNLACIGSTEFKRFDEDRYTDRAMFTSRIKGPVIKGDLLGHILMIPSH
ncbi:MAG: DUF22 domain-containing protein [Candidatus Thorarchaeota archaeon]|nr:DUF22 domain-containing protein [Candidatus Thorarchaeota archaeon]